MKASQTSLKNGKLMLAQLRCFVDGNYVILLTLITQKISVARAVPEENAAAVGKGQALFPLVILQKASIFTHKR